MKIHFERSGGFAGLSLRAAIDVQELSPQERAELQKLVEQANFFTTELGTPAAQGADRFNYTITIEDGQRMRSVTLPEGALPAEWEPLVERISAIVRRQK